MAAADVSLRFPCSLKADLLRCFLIFTRSRVVFYTCSPLLIRQILSQDQKWIKHIYGDGFIWYYCHSNSCSIIDLGNV